VPRSPGGVEGGIGELVDGRCMAKERSGGCSLHEGLRLWGGIYLYIRLINWGARKKISHLYCASDCSQIPARSKTPGRSGFTGNSRRGVGGGDLGNLLRMEVGGGSDQPPPTPPQVVFFKVYNEPAGPPPGPWLWRPRGGRRP